MPFRNSYIADILIATKIVNRVLIFHITVRHLETPPPPPPPPPLPLVVPAAEVLLAPEPEGFANAEKPPVVGAAGVDPKADGLPNDDWPNAEVVAPCAG